MAGKLFTFLILICFQGFFVLIEDNWMKNPINLAHNAFESYTAELSKITSWNTFEEIIKGINDRKTQQGCEPFDRKCTFPKISVHEYCDLISFHETPNKIFFTEEMAPKMRQFSELPDMKLLQIGLQILNLAHTDLKKIYSNFSVKAEKLMKLYVRAKSIYNVVKKFVKKQEVDGKLNYKMKFKFEAITQFYNELKFRISKARTDVDNLKIKLDNEVKLTEDLIEKTEQTRSSIRFEQDLEDIDAEFSKESFGNLSAACTKYVTGHGRRFTIHRKNGRVTNSEWTNKLATKME